MPYNLVIIFLGMYLNELGNFSQRNNYSYIFIVALFTLFNNKKKQSDRHGENAFNTRGLGV